MAIGVAGSHCAQAQTINLPSIGNSIGNLLNKAKASGTPSSTPPPSNPATAAPPNSLANPGDPSAAPAAPAGANALGVSAAASPPVMSTHVGPVPADLQPLADQMADELSVLKQLRPKQIGFKDFRLGRSMVAEGKPAGTGQCARKPDFSAGANKGVPPETLDYLRGRWTPVFVDNITCSASTTVLEKPATVMFDVRGPEQTIVDIVLTVARQDLSTISDLLSKSLGAPKDSSLTLTKDQVRAEIEKNVLKVCDDSRPNVRDRTELTDQQYAMCRGQVPGRVELAMVNVPLEGVITTARTWSTDGVVVSYTSVNTQPQANIAFYRSAGIELNNKATAEIKKEIQQRESLAKTNEEAKKAKDF